MIPLAAAAEREPRAEPQCHHRPSCLVELSFSLWLWYSLSLSSSLIRRMGYISQMDLFRLPSTNGHSEMTQRLCAQTLTLGLLLALLRVGVSCWNPHTHTHTDDGLSKQFPRVGSRDPTSGSSFFCGWLDCTSLGDWTVLLWVTGLYSFGWLDCTSVGDWTVLLWVYSD
jgi:hypothetical protein